jgi:uncharacterized protein (TIGR02145 family)
MKSENSCSWPGCLIAVGLLLILAHGCKKDDTPEPSGGIKDVDGNVYTSVTIGTQVWLVENLKVTKYRDGSAIPNVTDGGQWSSLTSGAFCNFENSTSNGNTYGRLYNWYAVKTGNLCPTGWHVPTHDEWITLRNYLIANGYNYDGSMTGDNTAKSLSSTTLWKSSTSTGAVGNTDFPAYRNKSGFTALPGGYRYFGSEFNELSEYGYWWTSSEAPQSDGYYWMWSYNMRSTAFNHTNPRGGFSVRCVKD